jgi:hypothetical protein
MKIKISWSRIYEKEEGSSVRKNVSFFWKGYVDEWIGKQFILSYWKR